MESSSQTTTTEGCAVLLVSEVDLDVLLQDLSSQLESIIACESSQLLLWIESSALNEEKYQNWHDVHRLLTTIYIHVVEVKHRLDKELFEVDVVLRKPGQSSWTEQRHSLAFNVSKVYYWENGMRDVSNRSRSHSIHR